MTDGPKAETAAGWSRRQGGVPTTRPRVMTRNEPPRVHDTGGQRERWLAAALP